MVTVRVDAADPRPYHIGMKRRTWRQRLNILSSAGLVGALCILILRPQGVLEAIAVVIFALTLLVPAAVTFWLSVREGYDQAERKDRQENGRCVSCGYKLKGNVSGACPECGTTIGTAHETATRGV